MKESPTFTKTLRTQEANNLTEARAAVEAVCDYVTSVKQVLKRDGHQEDFQLAKLQRSVALAFLAAGVTDERTIQRAVSYTAMRLQQSFDGLKIPTADEIRETVALTLIDQNLIHVAKRYLGFRHHAQAVIGEAVYGKGIAINRFYTKKGSHPYENLVWEKRDAVITSDKGQVVFEQRDVEVPSFYSQTATNIIVSKYFRGRLQTPERETSVRQLVDRVAQTIADWGRRGGYFASVDDADAFADELTSILIHQRAAFNSPVWFNVGVNPKPQCSACFINSVQDDMRSILNLAVTEGMLFKYGSGAGSNLSTLRSSREQLSNSSGKSSGPVSFMKGLDAFAGVIKSGGKTRRAAKMVVLNVEHPDVLDFVWCKAKEERKAHTLIDAGYSGDINGEAYSSIFFQNANNSVRVTDEFMKASKENNEWWTKNVINGEPCERMQAREVLRQIAEAAWECGDPGLQYDTTINDWHTCPNTDRIHASNPCSEYMFLNDSACNLASVNLMRCRKTNGDFDVAAFEHCCRIIITAQEIMVDFSSYPTPAIEQTSYDYRPLGLGYANLGSLIMSMGKAYDSDEARNLAAAITSVMSGTAYDQSSRIAERLGAFRGYRSNAEPMLRVMKKHRDSSRTIAENGVPTDLRTRAASCWDEALEHGSVHGYRNAQISVLAPTGTISFLMDCDTTGIEPPISIVSYKWLVGGGMMKLVNGTVPEALHSLGYTEQESCDIMKYIDQHDTIERAPHLKEEHLPVFDCAFKPAKGTRSIHYRGHIRMMAAVQPFLSGAISKTVNLPNQATVEDVMNAYMDGWTMGLKAIAIYRDGCKRSQPLTTVKEEVKDVKRKAPNAERQAVIDMGMAAAPRRRRLPDERKALTHKFQIGSHEGYITVGLYDDGQPGEIFITISKEGSSLSGLMDSFATSVSIGLQYGVPLRVLVKKFIHVRFEPSGFTQHPQIRVAKSIVDYIFRWMALKFLGMEERKAIGIILEGATTPLANGEETPKIETTAREETKGTNVESTTGPTLFEAGKLTGIFDNQSDAPACDTCGSFMVRNASCYKCLNCGATSGCS